jgi:hypothetical protein
MITFYHHLMRSAAIVLLIAAAVIVVAGAWPVLVAFRSMAHNLGDAPEYLGSALVAQSVALGIEKAAWPFFGAALLWRIDRRWPISTGAAE